MKPGRVICQFSHGEVTLHEGALAKSPKDFLLATPRGAYTTAQVRDGFSIVDWDLHVERLSRSIHALRDANGCLFQKFLAHVPHATVKACNSALSPLIASAVFSVLETANTRLQHDPSNPMFLIIVVCPDDGSPSFIDVRALLGGIENSRLQRVLSPSDCFMATILGPPRDIPIAKDTTWVSDREYLESMRPVGACECLLSTQEGCVLEGMITNFYVIRKMHRSDSEEFEFVLQTASVEEGVVWGTLRWRVLEACQCLGIRVVEQAPSMHERHTWKEAFLTNSLRGVQPLTRIVCDARNVWGLPSWELELPVHEASITEKLLQCIDALMERSLVDIRQVLAPL